MALSRHSIFSVLTFIVIGAFPYYSQAEKSEKSKLALSIQIKGLGVFEPHTFENRIDTKSCGAQRKPQNLIFLQDGRLKNVVAFLEPLSNNIPIALKPVDSKTINISNCEFSPRIAVLTPGASLIFKSTDNILFQLRSQTKLNGRKQSALPPNLLSSQLRYEEREIVPIVDDIHPWMRMYAIVEDKRLVEVSDQKGKITFENLSPGTYKLSFWHETMGFLEWEKPIDLQANMNISYDWKLNE